MAGGPDGLGCGESQRGIGVTTGEKIMTLVAVLLMTALIIGIGIVLVTGNTGGG